MPGQPRGQTSHLDQQVVSNSGTESLQNNHEIMELVLVSYKCMSRFGGFIFKGFLFHAGEKKTMTKDAK